MKTKDKILLFIPAYNCEKQIVRVLSQLDDSVMQYITEVIVVNNLSSDLTQEAALEFAKSHRELPIKILRNAENYGLGGSHKVAFDYMLKGSFDYCIVLHGDDQGDIHDFLDVFERGLYRKYDCVLGARFMVGSRLEGYSSFRTFGNIVYDFLFAAVLKRRVFDLGSGLNMYSRLMLKSRYYQRFPDDLTFNYCMIMAMGYYNQTCRFYPVSWREDDQVSNVKMGRQALKVLKMLKNYFFDPSYILSDLRQKKVEKYSAKEVLPSVAGATDGGTLADGGSAAYGGSAGKIENFKGGRA